MNQLLINFEPAHYLHYDTFLGTSNAELLFALKNHHSNLTLVWGDEGAGKSHLLQAWIANAVYQQQSALYISAATEHLLLEAQNQHFDYIAVDDVHLISADFQVKLLDVFNDIQARNSFLLVSANLAPQQLAILQDLRTRLGLCLTYQVQPLSDEEKFTAVKEVALARQMYIDDDIINYLLVHYSRDLNSLIKTIYQLDEYALQKQRRITIPLLKELMLNNTIGI